jgi:hypothetical protein
MLKRIITLSGVILLSGCVSTLSAQNEEMQYRQESMQAIQQSEENLSAQISTLQLAIENQTDYIESLEGKVSTLSRRVDNLTEQSSESSSNKTKESVTATAKTQPVPDSLRVLGSVETVTFELFNTSYDARIDTGAATSSLNATNIQEFERNGSTWVKFNLSTEQDKDAEPKWMEAPLIRYAKVRQSNMAKSEKRAVVELWITLGDIRQKAEFTLADRTHMSHPVLLGRSFIKDIAIVDVSKTYIQTKPL